MSFRLFGRSNWKVDIKQGSAGKWRWSIVDAKHKVRGLPTVQGHTTPEIAEADALAFLDGIGAPRLEVRKFIGMRDEGSQG